MTESRPLMEHRGPGALAAVANSLNARPKVQSGRGPRKARADFAGPDALVCVLYDALLPAEQAMVSMGEQQRVRESRMFLQVATSTEFVRAIEEIVYRKVHAFASATDPDVGVVMEIFVFEPQVSADGGPPQ
jgi:uncharacterized protein YbcI